MPEPPIHPGQVCDRAACPAPAACEILIASQDFYFCGHHAAELTAALLDSGLVGDRAADELADAGAPSG